MKKSFITIAFLFFIILLNGCAKESQKNSVIFYGETDKWIVIGTLEDTFKFSYKGNLDDLIKDNPDKKISFAYGTFLGCTIETVTLKSTTFYEVTFTSDLIKDDEKDSNIFINVKIHYGNTYESIDLQEYFPNKGK